MKKIVICLLMLMLLIVGCGGGSGSSTSSTPNSSAITGVDLSSTALNLAINDNGQLTAYVMPRSNANKITWTSSNNNIVTVDSSGKVTAKAAGTATIKATATDNTAKYASCLITVGNSGGTSGFYFLNQSGNDASCFVLDGSNYVLNSAATRITTSTNAVLYGSTASKLRGKENNTQIQFNGASISGNMPAVNAAAGTLDSYIEFPAVNATSLSMNFTLGASSGNYLAGAVAFVDNVGKIIAVESWNDSGATNPGTKTLSYTGTAVSSPIKVIFSRNGSSGGSVLVNSLAITTPGGDLSVLPTSLTLSPTSVSLDDTTTTQSITPTVLPNDVTVSTVTWLSSAPTVATVSSNGLITAVSNGTAVITASTINGLQATVTVTVSGFGMVIRASDRPIGYASIDAQSNFGGYGKSSVTVSNRDDLVSNIQAGNKIIYVDGMIDMSKGMLPTTGGGSTTALDNFVATNTASAYTSYNAFKTAYAAGCTKTTDDKSSGDSDSTLGSTLWDLNVAYKQQIQLQVASNTTIIGLSTASGIKGGTISISGVSNVAIRNMIIQDPYDPFPHHEENDGFNSQHDGICIQGSSSNIWIDHCTFQDTMTVSNVAINGGTEKWQTYDGLCDMKGDCRNITVSNCKFMNHDKTMLIGSSDSDGSNSTRTITLTGNYFYNCGQRLPMVRNSKLHVYNNYYDASHPTYSQSYAVGVRKNALIVAENNYFGSGINYSFKDSDGTLYTFGNSDNSSGGCNSTTSSTKPFTPAYSYTLDTAAAAKSAAETFAGAGKLNTEI